MRLLRASGDRPDPAVPRIGITGAPPRERRSTCAGRAPRRSLRGSSARAEIDPRSRWRWGACSGLLRASGDRPSWPTWARRPFEAPPRERRSTARGESSQNRPWGSSARAEIDPPRPSGSYSSAGLLRASGDRPAPRCAPAGSSRAPPRERRSTRVERRDLASHRGSSARAEIDPTRRGGEKGTDGLLRASGDRPEWRQRVGLDTTAPPRERRSTRDAERAEYPRRGSSARAEIDPTLRHDLYLHRRLLRASGDRPSSSAESSPSRWAPPRERRSTLLHLRARARGPGSSARAEIDRRRGRAPLVGLGLLRASGDRPTRNG